MMKKTKHLRIRITEAQFRMLADALITEERNRSVIVRNALDNYLITHHNLVDKQNQQNNRGKQTEL